MNLAAPRLARVAGSAQLEPDVDRIETRMPNGRQLG